MKFYINAGHSIKDTGAISGAFKENLLCIEYRDALRTALISTSHVAICVNDLTSLGGAATKGNLGYYGRDYRDYIGDTQGPTGFPNVPPKDDTGVPQSLPCVVKDSTGITLVSPCVTQVPRCPQESPLFHYDLALDIHFNAGPPKARGIEIFSDAPPMSPWGQLATRICRDTAALCGQVNRGVKSASQSARGSLAWIKLPRSLLVEVEFMTNKDAMKSLPPASLWGPLFAKVLVEHLTPLEGIHGPQLVTVGTHGASGAVGKKKPS